MQYQHLRQLPSRHDKSAYRCLRAWLRALSCGGLLFAAAGVNAACSGNEVIDETLPGGARWDLCATFAEREGLVLSDLYYTTPTGIRRRVLTEAHLAQVHVRFDDARPSLDAVTDLAGGGGFGAIGNLQPLSAANCPDGSVRTLTGSAALCIAQRERGYAYKSYGNVRQGNALVLTSHSTIGMQTYAVRWRLFDDGSVEPSIGISGNLPAIGNNAAHGWTVNGAGDVGVGFHTSVQWRLDFDLGSDADNDRVEQFEVIPSSDRLRKSLSVTSVPQEAALRVNPDTKRSWRVLDATQVNADQRAISYHLEPLHEAHGLPALAAMPWHGADLFVTRHNPCERYANANPTSGGCAANAAAYVDGEAIDPGNVVLWYRVNYHHVPSSEDAGGMTLRWQGVLIVPRDWTATNPLASTVTPNGRGSAV